MAVTVLKAVLLALVMASLGYLTLAWLLAYFFSSQVKMNRLRSLWSKTSLTKKINNLWPEVLQIKPIHKTDPETLKCVKSFLCQDYPGHCKVVLACNSQSEKIKDFISDCRHSTAVNKQFSLSVWPTENREKLGINPKISACMGSENQSSAEFIVISDADMRADDQVMRRIIQPFSDPKVGVVTSLYAISDVKSLGAGFEGVSITDFAASVLVARRVEGIKYAFGAVMAIRRKALEDIGGLSALKDYLADDYQLGFKSSQKGWKVAIANCIVEDKTPAISFKEYFTHQLRWMRTYRISRPGGYFAFLVTQGLLWSTLLLILSNFAWWAWLVFALWCSARTYWTYHIWTSLTQRPAPYSLLAVVKDAVYLVLWVLAFSGNTVKWGDTLYKILPNGHLNPINK